MEDSGKGGSESEEVEKVELRPVFQIGHLAFHYICVAGKYLQTTSAKLAAHVCNIEIYSQFWWSGASCGVCYVYARYEDHEKNAAHHPWWTNAKNNFPRDPSDVRLFSR